MRSLVLASSSFGNYHKVRQKKVSESVTGITNVTVVTKCGRKLTQRMTGNKTFEEKL